MQSYVLTSRLGGPGLLINSTMSLSLADKQKGFISCKNNGLHSQSAWKVKKKRKIENWISRAKKNDFKVKVDWYKLLCFGSPTVQHASQHVWFCTMWPDRVKGLFVFSIMHMVMSTVTSVRGCLPLLPKQSGNFGWNVNGKNNFVFPNGIFSGKRDFFKGTPKFPKGTSECAFHLVVFTVPGLLPWIAFDPIFREKVLEMERENPCGNFHSGFDAFHSLQLSINRFFGVNGKQPRFPYSPRRRQEVWHDTVCGSNQDRLIENNYLQLILLPFPPFPC